MSKYDCDSFDLNEVNEDMVLVSKKELETLYQTMKDMNDYMSFVSKELADLKEKTKKVGDDLYDLNSELRKRSSKYENVLFRISE